MARKKKLNAYTVQHEGRFIGGCSVVVSETKDLALIELNRELHLNNLKPVTIEDLVEVDLYQEKAIILFNGDY
jgi:hypothetical protein